MDNREELRRRQEKNQCKNNSRQSLSNRTKNTKENNGVDLESLKKNKKLMKKMQNSNLNSSSLKDQIMNTLGDGNKAQELLKKIMSDKDFGKIAEQVAKLQIEKETNTAAAEEPSVDAVSVEEPSVDAVAAEQPSVDAVAAEEITDNIEEVTDVVEEEQES